MRRRRKAPRPAAQPPTTTVHEDVEPSPSTPSVLLDSRLANLRSKASTLGILVLLNVIYIEFFFIRPLVRTPVDRHSFVLYQIASGALFLVAGFVTLFSVSRWESKDSRFMIRLTRVQILLDSALIAAALVFSLSLADPPQRAALFLVERLPYLEHLGAGVLEKIIDWVIGGIVFEIVRSWFMRRLRRIVASTHGSEPA